MSAAGQLRSLFQQTIGGTAPSGVASSTGDISQMLKFIASGSSTQSFYPLLGFTPPYVAGESNATISANTTITGSSGSVKRYKDLTINSGIVLTCQTTPQIIVCRNLSFGNTSSEIRAAFNTTQATADGAGGYGGSWYGTDATAAALNVASVLQPHFHSGGAGGTASATPTAGGNGTAYAFNAATMLLALLNGMAVSGGGNGGNGGVSVNSTGGSGGTYGFRGILPSGASGSGGGGGGGSGIGGGGGGGAGDSDVGPTSTVRVGGQGGGVVLVIVTGDITTAAGLITANGANGANATTNRAGASGAGGGGFAALIAKASTVVPTLQANGGTGGTAAAGGSAGGDGGAGATIRIVG